MADTNNIKIPLIIDGITILAIVVTATTVLNKQVAIDSRLDKMEYNVQRLAERPAAPVDSVDRLARIETNLSVITQRLTSIEQELKR